MVKRRSKQPESNWFQILQAMPAISNDDWRELLRFRSFNNHQAARQHINHVIGKFVRQILLEVTPRELKQMMKSFCSDMDALYPTFCRLSELNIVKQSLLPNSPFGSGKAAFGLDDSLFEEFKTSARNLLLALQQCVEQIPTRSGPTSEPEIELIRGIDQIVSQYSTGPLKRTDPNPPFGSDNQFIQKITEIAYKEAGKSNIRKKEMMAVKIDNLLKNFIAEKITNA